MGYLVCEMLGIWDVRDVGSVGRGMFRMWNVRDVRCLRCRMSLFLMGEILVENAQYCNLRSNTDFKKKTALALAYKTENLIFQDLELGKLCQDALKTVTVSRNVN